MCSLTPKHLPTNECPSCSFYVTMPKLIKKIGHWLHTRSLSSLGTREVSNIYQKGKRGTGAWWETWVPKASSSTKFYSGVNCKTNKSHPVPSEKLSEQNLHVGKEERGSASGSPSLCPESQLKCLLFQSVHKLEPDAQQECLVWPGAHPFRSSEAWQDWVENVKRSDKWATDIRQRLLEPWLNPQSLRRQGKNHSKCRLWTFEW